MGQFNINVPAGIAIAQDDSGCVIYFDDVNFGKDGAYRLFRQLPDGRKALCALIYEDAVYSVIGKVSE